MRCSTIHARLSFLVPVALGLLAACGGSSGSDAGPSLDGGGAFLDGAISVDAPATTCNSVLFDNGNVAACTTPTDTSVFTLSSAATVTYVRLWVNTTLSGPTISYALLGPSGNLLASGPTTKGSCDPYQKNWCEFIVNLSLPLPAGAYTVKSSAVATCSNSGSKNVGMVMVKGCASAAPPIDAAIPDSLDRSDTPALTCNNVLFDNGNVAACTKPTDTSVFTLSAASTINYLRLWVNTTLSGQSISYTLLGPTGTQLAAGPTTKGSCDPYQTNWCEFIAAPGLDLPAGTYTVKSSAVATCSNSGSKNIGMVMVKGCAATSTPVDAAIPDSGPREDAPAPTCSSVLFDNGNVAACTTPTDTSVFTLSAASTVNYLRLWVNTNLSGPTIAYALSGPAGNILATGPTTKGSCDPYQRNWCEFIANPSMDLAAGTYTVRSSAVATCSNSGTRNVGMIMVKGCAAGTSVPPVALDASAEAGRGLNH